VMPMVPLDEGKCFFLGYGTKLRHVCTIYCDELPYISYEISSQ
jgi:hypothetical protein